jgi:ribosomal protein S18 acetylase RimI-like enzyme
LEDVQRLLAGAAGGLLVADADGAILGALIAAWDGWRGNMYRLAVRSEHRRRGIGLALVRAGEEHLRRQGARRITALVGYEDEVASAFWEAAGYPQDHEIGRRVRNLLPALS